MKKIVVLFIVLAAVAALVWRGFEAREKEESETAKPEHAKVSRSASGEPLIEVDGETQERIGLKVEPLAGGSMRPEITAYGHVVDPTPLVLLDSDLTSAKAAEQSSRAEAERVESLFKSGQTVAKKNVEAAEAQFRADQTKATALERRMALEWGTGITSLDASARQQLIDRLVKNEAALVRVDLPAGEMAGEKPSAARIFVLGREETPITANEISPAAAVDLKTQAQGFLLSVDAPPFPLLPGTAVTAYIELPREPQNGVTIPRAAVVRLSGSAWVYVQADNEHFARREVRLDHPAQTGWFVTASFTPGEEIVTTGAQALLSEEQKSQGGEQGDTD